MILDRIRAHVARGVVPRVLELLPAAVLAQLAQVKITVRPRPLPEDLERGATPDHRGYFFGEQHEPTQTTELPDEQLPVGEIVIFTERIRPFTTKEIVRTVLHEIAHVVGFEEHEIVNDLELG